MFKKSYRHNIALVGASEFFGFFGITSFWLLFLSQHGMSFGQIGILESLFHLTSLLSEVPSGVLADRFTYRTLFGTFDVNIVVSIYAIWARSFLDLCIWNGTERMGIQF